ncbi:MAG: AAA family ATPase [bacterium]
MYLDYWGLSAPPFENLPNPDFLYYSPMHEEAMTRLLYAAHGRKGAAMLTGHAGTGKTTLSRAFVRQLDEDKFDVGLIANPSLSPLDFLKEILYQLDVEEHSQSKVELLRMLNDKMLTNIQEGRDTIVIIDEAQAIEDDRTLEELRLLLNFQMNDRFLLTLILIGQPELREKVANIPQLSQRISIKYHLRPLDFSEAIKFIFFRLKTAGLNKSVFSEEAIKLIFRSSGGIPRRLVNICDMCLLVGFTYKAPLINSKLVEKVVRDSKE